MKTVIRIFINILLKFVLQISTMLSVKGIYEEGKVKLLEKIQTRRRSNVIITFIDDPNTSEDEKLREFSSTGGALDFWNNEAENIYQDYIPKSKK